MTDHNWPGPDWTREQIVEQTIRGSNSYVHVRCAYAPPGKSVSAILNSSLGRIRNKPEEPK